VGPCSTRHLRVATVPRSWRQTLLVARFVWGAGAVVSHRAAAALWRLLGFNEAIVELTVPEKRKRTHGPGVIHRGLLLPRDVTVLDSIPVTVPARTLFDIAAVAPYEAVEEALDDALYRRMVTIPTLRRRLDLVARSGRPGVAAMRSLLEARDPSAAVPQSTFETRLLRHLKRQGLPAPIRQFPVHDEEGLIGRIDFAWPDARLLLEADSRRWHSDPERFESDRIRRNRLTVAGWRILHATWRQLDRNPTAILNAVEIALAGPV
jgi:very-short-patch-repair endonuclease